MAVVINRNEAPSHLFSIPELDFSGDLFAERVDGPWFRLGAWTFRPHRDERGVEDLNSGDTILNYLSFVYGLAFDGKTFYQQDSTEVPPFFE